MPRSAKDLLNYLFNESQVDQERDINAGEGVDQDIDALEKQLKDSENHGNDADVMATDLSVLEPHLKPLLAKLKEIGVEKPDDRIKNLGTHFILYTDDQYVHNRDLGLLQDIEKSEPLLDAGFIPLNGESDRNDNGAAQYYVVIIK